MILHLEHLLSGLSYNCLLNKPKYLISALNLDHSSKQYFLKVCSFAWGWFIKSDLLIRLKNVNPNIFHTSHFSIINYPQSLEHACLIVLWRLRLAFMMTKWTFQDIILGYSKRRNIIMTQWKQTNNFNCSLYPLLGWLAISFDRVKIIGYIIDAIMWEILTGISSKNDWEASK